MMCVSDCCMHVLQGRLVVLDRLALHQVVLVAALLGVREACRPPPG